MLALLETGDTDMKKILIIGATSGIAAACARLWAAERAELFLVGRNAEKLQQTADDLTTRRSASSGRSISRSSRTVHCPIKKRANTMSIWRCRNSPTMA